MNLFDRMQNSKSKVNTDMFGWPVAGQKLLYTHIFTLNLVQCTECMYILPQLLKPYNYCKLPVCMMKHTCTNKLQWNLQCTRKLEITFRILQACTCILEHTCKIQAQFYWHILYTTVF